MVSKLPDSANWRATSLPMPELAPVISTEALDDAGMPHYVSVDRHLCRCPPLSDTFAQTVDASVPAKVSLRGGQFVRWSRLDAQVPRTIYDQFGPALNARRPLVNHVSSSAARIRRACTGRPCSESCWRIHRYW